MNSPEAASYIEPVRQAVEAGDSYAMRLAVEQAQEDELLISLGLRFMIRDFCVQQKGSLAALSSSTRSAADITPNLRNFSTQFDTDFMPFDSLAANGIAFNRVRSELNKLDAQKGLNMLGKFAAYNAYDVFLPDDYIEDLRPAVIETLYGSVVAHPGQDEEQPPVLSDFRGGMYQVNSFLNCFAYDVLDFTPPNN